MCRVRRVEGLFFIFHFLPSLACQIWNAIRNFSFTRFLFVNSKKKYRVWMNRKIVCEYEWEVQRWVRNLRIWAWNRKTSASIKLIMTEWINRFISLHTVIFIKKCFIDKYERVTYYCLNFYYLIAVLIINFTSYKLYWNFIKAMKFNSSQNFHRIRN